MARNNFVRALVLLIGFGIGVVSLGIAGSIYLTQKNKKSELLRWDAVAPQGSAISDGGHVFAASSLDRVFQDGKTLLPPLFSNDVQLYAARNEFESFQVIVSAGSAGLLGVSVAVTPFVGSDTKPVSIETTIYLEGFVPTEAPYYPTRFVGPWPDPLIPNAPTDVDSGQTQPFWISVYIPASTSPGDYQAQVLVKNGGNVLRAIPIKLKIFPFALPVASHLKTAFDFYGHLTTKRYPQKNNETNVNYQARLDAINMKFRQMMLRYRMCPILNIDPTNNKDMSLLDRLRILGQNSFSVGNKGGTFNNNWPSADNDIEALLPLYRTYGEMLKLNQILAYSYIYAWDEGEIGNPAVAKICSMIHRAYPGLKTMVCYHGFWIPEESPNWGKDIDIWCFNLADFVEDQMRVLQKRGMEMWVYVSSPEGKGDANLALDFDSIDYRILPWLCWKYDVKGFLYWCVNWWEKVDPFLSARNVKWENNGNGLLFYPGQDGPWPSLRAEIWRDGMEDYEYIQLLLSRLRQMKSKGMDKINKEFYDSAVELLKVDDRIASGMFQFTKDASVILDRRHKIAQAIVEAQNILEKRIP